MTVDPRVWWFLARGSGIVGWGAATASVACGLLLSGRPLGRRPNAAWLTDLHRFLGAVTIAAVATHMGALVADSFVRFSWVDLLVPGASAWRPGATALGVIACYLLVAVQLTSMLRRRVPKRLWRAVHLTSFAVYALSTAHFFTAGTEARNPVVVLAALAATALLAALLAFRLSTVRAHLRPGSGRPAAAPS